MAEFTNRKNIVWAGLLVAASATLYALYAQGYFDWWLGDHATGRGAFNPAMCGRASISLQSVECSDGTLYVSVLNTGSVALGGNFVAEVSTKSMQTFLSNMTESPIMPGHVGRLVFSPTRLDGRASKVTVSFQPLASNPCDNVVAENDGLDMQC